MLLRSSRRLPPGVGVEDVDVSAFAVDQAAALESSGGDRDGGAARPEHYGEGLLRNRVRIKSAGLDYTFANGSVWYQTEQNSATV